MLPHWKEASVHNLATLVCMRCDKGGPSLEVGSSSDPSLSWHGMARLEVKALQLRLSCSSSDVTS